MKKFKFSLEKVLKQRNIVVDLAQKEFADAQSALASEVAVLEAMVEAKTRSLEQRTTMIQEGTDWVNSVSQINSFVSGQDLRIKNQNLRLLEFEKLVESRREILRQAVSEVKILEKLEEKKRAEHKIEADREQQADMDELSVLRFSRNESLIKGSHEDGI